MKLYDGGRAPNPRRVRIFSGRKGCRGADRAGRSRQIAAAQRCRLRAINPMQRVPALVLDDGTAIAESIAICRYFEGLHPDRRCSAAGALESALVEMWNRRVEFHLSCRCRCVFQHTASGHEGHGRSAGAGVGRSQQAARCGFFAIPRRRTRQAAFRRRRDYTMADITALIAVDFMRVSKLVVPDNLANVKRWHAAVSARPSAAA